jgi:hypothetical protein
MPMKDGTLTEFTLFSYFRKLELELIKENAMFEIEVILTLTVIRIILPIGLMLLLGESVRRKETCYSIR